MKLIKKKSLGQHFLSDVSAVSKIINAATLDHDSCVVEIGPGGGALTSKINEARPKRLFLIEKDKRLYDDLCVKYPDAKVFNIDACDVDLRTIVGDDSNLMVVGNLPYNVSTVILENLVKQHEHIKGMVLMFQKEVGDRILASVGSSEYGRLSLLVGEFYKVKRSFVLRPGSFTPPPKVDSIVLVFERRDQALVNIKDRAVYEKLLMLVFSQRRKMLRRSLRSMLDEDTLRIVQEKSGVSFDKRPQELSIQELARISNLIS